MKSSCCRKLAWVVWALSRYHTLTHTLVWRAEARRSPWLSAQALIDTKLWIRSRNIAVEAKVKTWEGMALANIMEDDFTELMREEAEDVFTDGRVIQGQGIVGGILH